MSLAQDMRSKWVKMGDSDVNKSKLEVYQHEWRSKGKQGYPFHLQAHRKKDHGGNAAESPGESLSGPRQGNKDLSEK